MLLFCVLNLVALHLLLLNSLVSRGKNVNNLEKEIQQITEENTDIRQEIASYSSLLVVRKKAEEMGFIDKTKSMTLWLLDQSVALKLQ